MMLYLLCYPSLFFLSTFYANTIPVLGIGNGRVIAEMIEAAGIGLGAAITGTRGSIPPVTGEGNETRTGRAAMAGDPAMLVIVAFQREGTLI